MKNLMLYSVVLVCAGMCTFPVLAQDVVPPPAPTMNTPAQDKMFLHKASEGGYAEVQLGQLATQKASNPDVKAFGQKMADDHTMLNNNLQPFVEKAGLMPPTHLSKRDQMTYDKLSALSGDDFDKAYVSDMVEDHHKDLHEFRHESMVADDPALKDAVSSAAKVIAEHTHMAMKLANEIGAPMPMRGPKAAPVAPPAQ